MQYLPEQLFFARQKQFSALKIWFLVTHTHKKHILSLENWFLVVKKQVSREKFHPVFGAEKLVFGPERALF